MSSAASLNFIQELRALELELSTLLTFVENPEECPDLFNSLIPGIRKRLEKLVNIFIEFTLIGNAMQLSTGEGKEEQRTNGLALVSELLIDSLFTLLIRTAVSKADNLAVTKDLLTVLHNERELPKSDQILPSFDDEISNLLITMSRMKSEYVKSQEKEEKNIVVETTAAENTTEAVIEDTQVDNA